MCLSSRVDSGYIQTFFIHKKDLYGAHATVSKRLRLYLQLGTKRWRMQEFSKRAAYQRVWGYEAHTLIKQDR